MRAARCLSRAW